jgi:hypothetical protein
MANLAPGPVQEKQLKFECDWGKFSPGAGPTLTGGSCCSAYSRATISDVPLDWAKTVFSTVE